MARFTKEQLDKLTNEQKLQWDNASESERVMLEGIWRRFIAHDTKSTSSLTSKVGNVDILLEKGGVDNKDLEEVIRKLEKENKALLLKNSRKSRPIPLATNVTLDISNKIKFIMETKGFKKVDAIETAIEEYFKTVSK